MHTCGVCVCVCVCVGGVCLTAFPFFLFFYFVLLSFLGPLSANLSISFSHKLCWQLRVRTECLSRAFTGAMVSFLNHHFAAAIDGVVIPMLKDDNIGLYYFVCDVFSVYAALVHNMPVRLWLDVI